MLRPQKWELTAIRGRTLGSIDGMDPVLITQLWWIAPGALAAGTVGFATVRWRGSRGGRRLALDAARHDVKVAQQIASDRRHALKMARADAAHAAAERSARRLTGDDVAAARQILRERERELRAAQADLHAKRVRLSAARAALPSASAPRPLDRLRAEHDAITARWMSYETDPAMQIAYPAMTDVRQPATAAYLRAAGQAVEARRETEYRATPATYSAYRDAVAALERSLVAAEHHARVQSGERASAPGWQDVAQDVLSRSAEVLDKAAEAAASALSSWNNRKRR